MKRERDAPQPSAHDGRGILAEGVDLLGNGLALRLERRMPAQRHMALSSAPAMRTLRFGATQVAQWPRAQGRP